MRTDSMSEEMSVVSESNQTVGRTFPIGFSFFILNWRRLDLCGFVQASLILIKDAKLPSMTP